MFDGFSWAAMGVMVALIALIVTLVGLWVNSALKRTGLKIRTEVGEDITRLSTKTEERFGKLEASIGELEANTNLRFAELEASIGELEANTNLRFAEFEARADRQFGAIRVDLGQINVRLKNLENQVSPVMGQLVETGLENTPAASGAAKQTVPAGGNAV